MSLPWLAGYGYRNGHCLFLNNDKILCNCGGHKNYFIYFFFPQKNDHHLNSFISAVVNKDWYSLVETCELISWKKVLVTLLTHAKDAEFRILSGKYSSKKNDKKIKLQNKNLSSVCLRLSWASFWIIVSWLIPCTLLLIYWSVFYNSAVQIKIISFWKISAMRLPLFYWSLKKYIFNSLVRITVCFLFSFILLKS